MSHTLPYAKAWVGRPPGRANVEGFKILVSAIRLWGEVYYIMLHLQEDFFRNGTPNYLRFYVTQSSPRIRTSERGGSMRREQIGGGTNW